MESTSALILDDSYPRADILNKIPLWRSRIKQKKKEKHQQSQCLSANAHTGSAITRFNKGRAPSERVPV